LFSFSSRHPLLLGDPRHETLELVRLLVERRDNEGSRRLTLAASAKGPRSSAG
jgi:hypothetical protein